MLQVAIFSTLSLTTNNDSVTNNKVSSKRDEICLDSDHAVQKNYLAFKETPCCYRPYSDFLYSLFIQAHTFPYYTDNT